MSYLEKNTLCPYREYEANERLLIQPDSLVVNEFYTIMVAAKSVNAGNRAAKAPTQIIDVKKNEVGLFDVRFALVDNDLKPTYKFDSVFTNNGYYVKSAPELVAAGTQVTAGYFKGFDDGVNLDALGIGSSLELVGSE